jgi:hypothetical protein
MNITSILPEGHTEGAGSQIQRFLFAYLFCRAKNFNYLHVWSDRFEGHDSVISGDNIDQIWKEIFGLFKSVEMTNNSTATYYSDKDDKSHVYSIDFKRSYEFIESMGVEGVNDLLVEARKDFYSSTKYLRSSLSSKGEFIIGLHLRALSQGDVFRSYDSLPWQYFNFNYGLPNNNPHYYSRLYANAVNNILSSVPTNQLIYLHIHSTGSESDFSELLALLTPEINVRLFLKEAAPIAFLDLLYADIAIASHSSFSWLVLLLRSGPTYIRGGFRQFLTSSTFIVEEVLYENGHYFVNTLTFAKMLFCYLLFFPKYCFTVLSTYTRLFFKRHK